MDKDILKQTPVSQEIITKNLQMETAWCLKKKNPKNKNSFIQKKNNQIKRQGTEWEKISNLYKEHTHPTTTNNNNKISKKKKEKKTD